MNIPELAGHHFRRKYQYCLCTWIKDSLTLERKKIVRRTFYAHNMKEAQRISKLNYKKLTSVPHTIQTRASM